MTVTALVPALVALLGVVLYLVLAGGELKTKAAEVARACMWCGLLA